MRIAMAITVCAACTQWQRVRVRDVDNDDVLVMTERHAYELTEASVHDAQIVGHRERMWKVADCSLAPVTASPVEYANACHWQTLPTETTSISIEMSAIEEARAKRIAAGTTALAV